MNRFSRTGGVLAVTALGLMSLGIDCSPTNPPGCPSCPVGTVPGCAGACQTPVAIDSACSTDPCATNGRCVDGASCYGGKCVNLGVSLGSLCPTSPNDACPASLYCKGIHCLPPTGPFTGPICAFPSGLGSTCDGDVTKNGGTPGCMPCDVPLKCEGASGGVDGKCHATCTVDTDCPCGAGQRCSTGLMTDPPSPDGTCFRCLQVADDGCGPETPCCDGTKCKPASDGIIRCCKPKGEVCVVNKECCAGSVCRLPTPTPGLFTPGVCGACAVIGESCIDTAECCEGSCISGVCRKPCVQDAPCAVKGAKGECAKGKAVSDQFGNETCIGPAPVAESCNGRDDDCDGVVDNIPPEPCTVTPTGCQTGFKATGAYKCAGTSKVCDVSKTYCGIGGVPCGASATAGFCGGCLGEVCLDTGPKVTLCAPNLACVGGGGPLSTKTCKPGDACVLTAPPKCWLPEEIGKCVP